MMLNDSSHICRTECTAPRFQVPVLKIGIPADCTAPCVELIRERLENVELFEFNAAFVGPVNLTAKRQQLLPPATGVGYRCLFQDGSSPRRQAPFEPAVVACDWFEEIEQRN